ncbi:unnamed protein product [Rotaria magnacalcarata]|uniref:Uncharacterized protein n=2 Tax=Rotaria magnacalcarata TaxID=392030 RepID=A0A819RG95_9BILA|nr:unnamed protein product [Rotaria magnacalcarata]CAF2060280.1 unnamed protein product [Rotaria magnacalcarata]CAF4043933.1 unnamed protein product [Rotaria magnacalcarata]CAF4043965.1 unnamed protein product [Rotaria magnacalcarata]
MTQIVYVPSIAKSKYSSDPLKNDWNDFQHLATQARYVAPKTLSELKNQQFKLASVKKQLFNPKLPSIRRMERDDVLCRLADEHCRHTTSITEELFENFDPTKDDAYIDLFGLNWHDTGKSLMDINDLPQLQQDALPVFGARLRPDKSQIETRPILSKLYRSPSMSCLTPSATLTKPVKYSYRNYGSGTFDTTTKNTLWPRFHMNTRNSFDSINRMPLPSSMQGIFRSASMNATVSTAAWKPSGPIGCMNNSKMAEV